VGKHQGAVLGGFRENTEKAFVKETLKNHVGFRAGKGAKTKNVGGLFFCTKRGRTLGTCLVQKGSTLREKGNAHGGGEKAGRKGGSARGPPKKKTVGGGVTWGKGQKKREVRKRKDPLEHQQNM